MHLASLLPFIWSALFAASKSGSRKSTTWFIDGNNLLAQKGTTRDAQSLADKLRPIKGYGAEMLCLVFDGREGQELDDTVDGNLRIVKLAEGVTSDDFILEAIEGIVNSPTSNSDRIQLVTADRGLRRLALTFRPNVKGVVNPLTFYKKYIPRMSGLKKRADDPETESSD
mmetsp:Transcript_9386/g.26801  ORF Transcript_9386/g.26801 Transcript_9386/m.26801 type:complete len:170 (+) Transcript_9386:529-1038(+)|eukprot:CAMPEP_0119560336 /NCGR_PEP_ID=MMETSP1352-20130426/14604_1 /TAXON_ID=265584 /ORGANISM="Stauroneis constricta, Strain CCMP1120" /LENGTH=169 /DNA_ID=CAMNT_0007608295 /DNA_START=904 /DNA_END=1413 /DNA_ORIENTATION=+